MWGSLSKHTILGLLICVNAIQAHILVKGKVVDASTQLPIVSAMVYFSSTSVTTDALGVFVVDTDTMIHQLDIKAPFYHEKTIDIPQNLPELLVIYMDPSDIHQLAEVVIESDAAHTLHTLAKVDLNSRTVNSSQDLLRMVPGLFLAQHAGGGKAEQIFLRGFDIDHGTDIHITVDGLPVNMVSHAHGQGYADLHFVIPELVQNIEYGKGPYETALGNMATAGHVRFKTVEVLDKSRVSVEAGQFNTLRNVNLIDLLGTTKKGLNKSAFVASEIYTSDGPFERSQHFNRFNLLGKYTTQTDHSLLSIQAMHFSSKWDASGQLPERAVKSGYVTRFGAIDPTEGGTTSRSSIVMNYQQKPDASVVLDHTLYLSHYHFDLYSNFTFFLRDSINGDQIRQKERRNLMGYNGTYTHTKLLGAVLWKQKYGVGLRYDHAQDVELSYTRQRKWLSHASLGTVHEYDYGAFAEQQLSLGRFHLYAGLRLNRMRWEYANALDSLYRPMAAQKDILLPKLNLTYSPSKQLQLYLKLGRGFHSNDARTVVAYRGRGMMPAVYGGDLGGMAKVSKRLWCHTTLWVLFSEQEFVYVGDEGVVEPSGRSLRKGIDLSGRYQISTWLFTDMDITLAMPKTLDMPAGSDHVPLAPLFTTTAGLSCKWPNGINGSLRLRHIGDRPANETNTVKAKGYTIFDASMYYTQPKFEVGLLMQNLFNVQWNEAQFDTTSRLQGEPAAISELHFTPGAPLCIKLKYSYLF